jgi:hypothetical protein
MADNDVSLKLPSVPIVRENDVIFKIKINRRKFGTLTVRNNSLTWSSDRAPGNTLEVTWKAFDEWMRARIKLAT